MSHELELSRQFSAELNCPIKLFLCREQVGESDLSDAEKLRLAEMKHPLKRESWLRGRFALKNIVAELEDLSDWQTIDTMQIRMPNANYSLSHSGDFAASVFSAAGKGIGVDLEMERIVKSGSTKFFLASHEKDWTMTLSEGPEQNDQILRLWTVKEALFKSDLQNEGKTVSRYVLDEPPVLSGSAFTLSDSGGKSFRYSSQKFLNYWLTIAIPQA